MVHRGRPTQPAKRPRATAARKAIKRKNYRENVAARAAASGSAPRKFAPASGSDRNHPYAHFEFEVCCEKLFFASDQETKIGLRSDRLARAATLPGRRRRNKLQHALTGNGEGAGWSVPRVLGVAGLAGGLGRVSYNVYREAAENVYQVTESVTFAVAEEAVATVRVVGMGVRVRVLAVSVLSGWGAWLLARRWYPNFKRWMGRTGRNLEGNLAHRRSHDRLLAELLAVPGRGTGREGTGAVARARAAALESEPSPGVPTGVEEMIRITARPLNRGEAGQVEAWVHSLIDRLGPGAEVSLPAGASAAARCLAHQVAEARGCGHVSVGEGAQRVLTISRPAMAIPPFPGTEAFGQPQQEERVPSVAGDVGGGPAHLGTPPGRGGQNPFTPPASPAVLRGGPADLLATPERRPGTSRGAWLCGNAERRVDEAERRAEQLRSGAKDALLASEAECRAWPASGTA